MKHIEGQGKRRLLTSDEVLRLQIVKSSVLDYQPVSFAPAETYAPLAS